MVKKLALGILLCVFITGCSQNNNSSSDISSNDSTYSSENSSISSNVYSEKDFIKDDVVGSEVNIETLIRIAKNYNIMYDFNDLDNNEELPFSKAFKFFKYAGAYNTDVYLRSELKRFYNEETNTFNIPSEIIDKYLITKFNTKVNHDQVEEYVQSTDSYLFEPFQGEYYYETVIIKYNRIENNMFEFECISTGLEGVEPKTQKFVVEIRDNNYKYVSVS